MGLNFLEKIVSQRSAALCAALRAENDKLRVENAVLRASLEHADACLFERAHASSEMHVEDEESEEERGETIPLRPRRPAPLGEVQGPGETMRPW